MAKKEKTKVSKFTEDWLPIKEIKNGMIFTEGKLLEGSQIVTGVRIEPKNIFIAGDEVINRAIIGLQNFYNTITYEFWLICCDRPVDINIYKSELEVLYNNAQNAEIRKIILEDIKKCELFIGPAVNAVDTEFYILFKDSSKDMQAITKKIQNIITGLASAGINSRQLTDDDVRVLLDSFFNDSKRIEYGTVIANV